MKENPFNFKTQITKKEKKIVSYKVIAYYPRITSSPLFFPIKMLFNFEINRKRILFVLIHEEWQ